jgi:hypothetical protein
LLRMLFVKSGTMLYIPNGFDSEKKLCLSTISGISEHVVRKGQPMIEDISWLAMSGVVWISGYDSVVGSSVCCGL